MKTSGATQSAASRHIHTLNVHHPGLHPSSTSLVSPICILVRDARGPPATRPTRPRRLLTTQPNCPPSSSPLAQNQYMGFKVVLFKPLKMTNKQKYLCKAHNCVQNLGGAHISNVIFLILLLLFCCFMCVGIPTHVKFNAIFPIFPIPQNWVCAS